MNRCIVEFISKCLNCKQVKVEHQRPDGMAQNIDILEWKWEIINIDFLQVCRGLTCNMISFG